MDRTHTIEVMDYPWFPSSLRTCMTNNIIVIARLMGVPGVLGELVSRVLREHELRHIVDLSSGGGGSMPEVLQAVRTEPGLEEVGLTLTDLYPNDEAVDRFQGEGGVTYLRAPVDATDLGSAPVELLREPSLMVMCNAFHHMRPEGAREILKSAHDAKQPLLIYEMGTHLPAWLWVVSMDGERDWR